MTNLELIAHAKSAAENAYSPYSGFKVGAALLDADGNLFCGCNVENSSYSATICAERCAFVKAVSEGKREFARIAVVGGREGDYSKPCIPCGVCLQVMSELCDDDFTVLLCDGDNVVEYDLCDLIPIPFRG